MATNDFQLTQLAFAYHDTLLQQARNERLAEGDPSPSVPQRNRHTPALWLARLVEQWHNKNQPRPFGVEQG